MINTYLLERPGALERHELLECVVFMFPSCSSHDLWCSSEQMASDKSWYDFMCETRLENQCSNTYFICKIVGKTCAKFTEHRVSENVAACCKVVTWNTHCVNVKSMFVKTFGAWDACQVWNRAFLDWKPRISVGPNLPCEEIPGWDQIKSASLPCHEPVFFATAPAENSHDRSLCIARYRSSYAKRTNNFPWC